MKILIISVVIVVLIIDYCCLRINKGENENDC